MRAWIVGVLLAALGPGALAHAEAPPPGAVPFPVNKTTKLRAKDGPVYFIDGPTVIPKNVEITVQLDVVIVGVNNASLEVQGGLKIHGTQDHWVKISNVDFSPTRAPSRGFHLDMVDLSNVRFVHAEGPAATGTFVIENGAMQRDCAFDFRIAEGALKLMTVDTGIPWKIRCEPPAGEKPDIELQIRTSWVRELEISGPADATVRSCVLKNGVVFRGAAVAVVDGCDVNAGAIAFHQGAEDSFKKITLTKCNLFEGARLVLDRAPNPDGKKEKVKVDKFYFGPKAGGGAAPRKEQLATLIDDGTDEPARKVLAVVGKPVKRRHQLAASSQLLMRVPKVR